ncbi:MAG TPA: class I SAM-dependent methyltransferase [Phycisphaerae bacterium]|nr:class I SAM-dependent methyltransferase [Phycisphaerae bacterium]HQE29760.1 class I SAM-dependent methyltransferase [Phycisphaerae bacterium]
MSSSMACLVCGTDAFQPHLEILLRCPSCGFVTARTDGAIDYRALYDGDYFKGAEYLDYAADEAFFKKNFRRRLAEVRRHTPSGRLLEIGAAYGFFLDLAREHFDVIGYEVNREGAAYARERFGIDVRTTDFLEASESDIGGAVDVTVMWDVIEHLERPDAFIRRIAEFTRPGGTLHITTGDIGSTLARLRGRKWRMVHPPTHLHYFDRQTLPQLLARCGFRTIQVRTVGVARSFRQILYSILALRLGSPGLYRIAHKCLPATWGFTLDTRDIMYVTATRE